MEINNKIYIPVNIQTNRMIFTGYGINELYKSFIFFLCLCLIWGVVFLFAKSTTQLIFELMVSIVISVVVFVRDVTNQCMVDYIKYILRFSCSNRKYKYDNNIESEEDYIVRKYKENIIS